MFNFICQCLRFISYFIHTAVNQPMLLIINVLVIDQIPFVFEFQFYHLGVSGCQNNLLNTRNSGLRPFYLLIRAYLQKFTIGLSTILNHDFIPWFEEIETRVFTRDEFLPLEECRNPRWILLQIRNDFSLQWFFFLGVRAQFGADWFDDQVGFHVNRVASVNTHAQRAFLGILTLTGIQTSFAECMAAWESHRFDE